MFRTEDLRNAYSSLYEDLLVAATDDYTEYLKSSFGPAEQFDWTNEKEAKGALRHLIKEAYESYTEPEESLRSCGISAEMEDFIYGKPAPAKKKHNWPNKIKTATWRDDLRGILMGIPDAEFDASVIDAFVDRFHRYLKNACKYWDAIPERYRTGDLVLRLLGDTPGDLRYLPDKSIITKEVAEKIIEKVGAGALSCLPAAVKTNEFVTALVAKDPRGLSGVPKQLRTVEMCERALLDGIAWCEKDPAVRSQYHNSDIFERQLALVPGGPNALSVDVKKAVVCENPHTLKIFADEGEFERGADGNWTNETWELFFAAVENAPRMAFTYFPVEMIQKACLDAKRV